jgi:hypothetical protein
LAFELWSLLEARLHKAKDVTPKAKDQIGNWQSEIGNHFGSLICRLVLLLLLFPL